MMEKLFMADETIKKKDLTDFMEEVKKEIKLNTSSISEPNLPTGSGGSPSPPDPNESEEYKTLRKERDVLRKELDDKEVADKKKILDSFDKERQEKYKDSSLEILEAVQGELATKNSSFISADSKSKDESSEKRQPSYLDRSTQKIVYT